MHRAFSFSVALHLSLLIVAILIFASSPSRKLSPNYVVTLVDTPGSTAATAEPAPAAEQAKSEVTPQKKAESPKVVPGQSKQEKMQEEQLLRDRVAALKSKRKIETIVAQRRMAEVSASQQKPPSASAAAKAEKGKPGGGDYVSLVTTRIRQNWIYQGSNEQALEATVLLRVRRDGSATVDKIIKSSGSPLFDRSVLRAITKASPFPPPPQEIEIEARFFP